MKTLNDNQTKLVTRFTNASVNAGKAEDSLRNITILTFCNLDREQSEKAIQDIRDTHRANHKPEAIEAGKPVPTFEATRKMINRILSSKTVEISWNADNDLTLKTERSTGIVSFTAKALKGTDSKSTGNIEKVNDASKEIAKVAGFDHDDRLAAVRQVMSDCNVNPAEVITYLFSGLTPEVQADCILNLTASATPVLANKMQIKKLVNK